MRRLFLIIFSYFISVIFLFCQIDGWKVGIIIPIPPVEIKNPIRLIREDTKILINENLATVTKQQIFKNSSNRQVEGKYLFPIPYDAFINAFSLFVGNEKIEGEILSKNEAKKIYEDIVRKYRDPALLEMIGNNLFRANIFPFSPYGERKIEIRYSQLLLPTGNTYRLIYPLNLCKNVLEKKIDIEIEINTSKPITNIYSPTHDLKIEQINEKKYKIKLNIEKEEMNSDLIVYYSFSNNNIESMSLFYSNGKEDPYFMLRISSQSLINKNSSRKNVIFVLDISGSMTGKKIEQAKEALVFCIKRLNKNDIYSVITFSNNTKELVNLRIFVNEESEKEQIQKILQIEPEGGTNLFSALETSLKKAKPEIANYVVFLTDGLPTVGIKNPDEILKNIKKNYKEGVRIYTFGVGNDLDPFLLDKLASEFGGISNYVRENESIENELSVFFNNISNPILTNCKLSYNRSKIYDVFPYKLPDLFKNSTITIFGRIKQDTFAGFKFTGIYEKEIKNYYFNVTKDSLSENNSFIPLLWAKRKIAFLLDEIRNNGEDKELIDEVIKLSKKYGIITPYTSYLVYEEDKSESNLSKPIINKSQLFDNRTGYIPLKEDLRETMIIQSNTIQKMKNSSQINYSNFIKNIKDKTFIFKENYWIDIEYDDKLCKEIIEVDFASEHYFSLITEDNLLRDYFSISDKVKVYYNSKCYIVK